VIKVHFCFVLDYFDSVRLVVKNAGSLMLLLTRCLGTFTFVYLSDVFIQSDLQKWKEYHGLLAISWFIEKPWSTMVHHGIPFNTQYLWIRICVRSWAQQDECFDALKAGAWLSAECAVGMLPTDCGGIWSVGHCWDCLKQGVGL